MRPTLALLCLFLPSVALAQSVDAIRWVPNGPVYALARRDGVTYVGGDFTIVSPPSGQAAPIDTASATVPAGFPQVSGRVFTIIGDGSGGWYIGGQFTMVGGVQRNNIAQVASDLTLTSWNPNANGAVRALARTPFGSVYAGGDFTTIGGQVRSRLAELDPTAGTATFVNYNMNNTVRALVSSGNVLYIGGDFTSTGTGVTNRLFAINLATGNPAGWNPGANGPVYALELSQSTANILVGGAFSMIGGLLRSNLAAVSTSGSIASWDPNPNGPVRHIQEQASGDYVGGDFTHIGGQTRNHLAGIVPSTGSATAWNPNVDGPVETFAWSNNFVFVGGTFTTVGGQSRLNAAKIDAATGIVAAWDPRPNNTVRALAPGGAKIYAGGDFTGFGGVARKNLCAFDDWTHNVTTWDPQADAPVRALALQAFGPVVYTVYAGGDFTHVNGQARSHLAALHPRTGVPTSWITDTNLPVRALAVNDTLVLFGGDFTSTNGEATAYLSSRRHTGGPLIHLEGLGSGSVLAIAPSTSLGNLEVGGNFGLALFNLANHTLLSVQNPATNGAVRALVDRGSGTFYLGGDFTTVGGQPRSHLAKVTGTTQVDGWNPGADDTVRALAQGESGLLAGGDFMNAANIPRWHVVQIDQVTGAAFPWVANTTDGDVYAIANKAAQVDIGGTFHGIWPSPSAGYAVVGPGAPTQCGAPLASLAGARPRALTVLDADGDGIEDLAVCEDGGATAHLLILRGNGAGQFALAQTIDAATSPMAVTAADFDRDGQVDLAVSESDTVGTIALLHNVGGTFQPWTTVPLYGRSDGLAAGDYDADGIADLVVCLVDSASTPKRGGLAIFKGGGSSGTWDGTFAYVSREPRGWPGSARRVIAHDFNRDGFTDFFYTGIATFPFMVLNGPGFDTSCENALTDFPSPVDGFALAYGDFNEDGLSDIVAASARRLFLRHNNGMTTCGNLFTQFDQVLVTLASTPRDLAVMDVDRDGILDVICAFDSLSSLVVYPGGGTGGVPDGTFRLPVTLDTHDVWSIGLGDFVSDGITDIATTMATCGYVSTWQNGATPQFPMTIHLDSPNGGESFSRTPPPPGPPALAVVDVETSAAVAAPPSKVASQQTISWTKGAGVHGVDVELSRNDGQTWQTIAANVPGTAMTWFSTPPATGIARVRVRDAAYREFMDASDAPFSIISGIVGTPPPGAPLLPRLALVGQHPVHGSVRFLLDVPASADVAVVLYDALGRTVRTLARGRYAPGSHDLAWDAKDDRGEDCRRGVYFIRTKIGAFEDTRKIVML